MESYDTLPDGKWLCPECELPDPAKFGGLRDGRKSKLDWFSVGDLEAARVESSIATGEVEPRGCRSSNGSDQFLVVNGFVLHNNSAKCLFLDSDELYVKFQDLIDWKSSWPLSQIPIETRR